MANLTQERTSTTSRTPVPSKKPSWLGEQLDDIRNIRWVRRWRDGIRCRQRHPKHCPHDGRHWHASGRADIQGLRMVAVLVVVLDHLTGWPAGGFVGVDVFFVISGFLITGRLLRMAGNVSVGKYFGQFYKLRATRILPASLATLAATGLAFSIFLPERAGDVWVDAFWAAIFMANWHFAWNGTDYLHAGGPVSPIQHFWSLSVEEQFYFVWPIVLLLAIPIAAIFGGSQKARRLVAGGAAALVCVVGLWWAFHQTAGEPTIAYFSSFTRAWELGAGALLACCVPLLKKIPNALATITSWTGLALIVASLFLISDESAFPAPWALLPVVGSVLVVAAGGIAVPKNWILNNRGSNWIGDISYSIYLVHFPLIILITALLPHDKYLSWVSILLMTFGFAMLSYYLIEEPVRNWADPARAVYRDLPRLAGFGSMLAIVGMLCFAFQSPPTILNIPQATSQGSTSAEADPAFAQPTDDLYAKLSESLAGSSLPKPTNADDISTEAAWNDWEPCNTETTVLESCTFAPDGQSDPKKVALVVGDSVALSYIPAVRAALNPKGWTVVGFAKQQCGAADVPVVRTGAKERFTACDDHHAAYADVVKQVKPTLVVLSSVADAPDRMFGEATTQDYNAGVARAVKTLTASGAKALIITAPPLGKMLSECAIAGATPADCSTSPGGDQAARYAEEQQVAEQNGTAYLNMSPLFCYEGYCPGIVDGVAVRYDKEHMAPAYAKVIGPSLYESIVKAGAIPTT